MIFVDNYGFHAANLAHLTRRILTPLTFPGVAALAFDNLQ